VQEAIDEFDGSVSKPSDMEAAAERSGVAD
jgi:hypothetical protein